MKNLRIIILFLSMLSLGSALAQQVESLHSIKLGFPSLTYSYEHALGKQFSINMEAGVKWGWQSFNNSLKINSNPFLQIEPRFYYNVKKRFGEGKFLNNSASFFSICSGVDFIKHTGESYYPTLFVVPKWGFRRAIGKHFIFETQIGGGVQFNRYSTKFRPDLNLKFGYVF